MLRRFLVLGSLLGSLTSLAAPAEVGTAHPLGGVMAAKNGRWFVLCQARADTDGNGKLDTTYDIHFQGGDRMLPYLVLGSGPGTEIGYPAAQSKHGEWLAVVTGDKLELIEAATFKRETIDAELINDHHWTTEKNARFISIAANGKRMTYLKGNTIVIRDLGARTERSVTVKGKLWRADVDAEGRWAKVLVMRRDTDKNGKIDWPGGPSADSLSGCGVDTLHHRNPEGDEPTVAWLDLVTGQMV